MRRLGVMPYITPLQRATESSRMPKSVMKTTVGGGCAADCCARTGIVARNSRTSHKQKVRIDFAPGVNVILIKSNSPKRLRWSAGRPRRLDGRDESVSQPRAPQKSGPRYCYSREAATRESPARQCREAKVEQSRVPEGRHSSCDTVSRPTSLHRRSHQRTSLLHHRSPSGIYNRGGKKSVGNKSTQERASDVQRDS